MIIAVLFCRCVAHEQRHLSLGVISFFVRTFGAIPGPLITGAIFDSVCQLRHELQEQCGLPGNCLVYDNEALALRSAIMLFVGMAVSAVFAFFVWFVYPKKKANYKQDNEETAETENSTNTNSVSNSEVFCIHVENNLCMYEYLGMDMIEFRLFLSILHFLRGLHGLRWGLFSVSF